jgi:hypothetical protein
MSLANSPTAVGEQQPRVAEQWPHGRGRPTAGIGYWLYNTPKPCFSQILDNRSTLTHSRARHKFLLEFCLGLRAVALRSPSNGLGFRYILMQTTQLHTPREKKELPLEQIHSGSLKVCGLRAS